MPVLNYDAEKESYYCKSCGEYYDPEKEGANHNRCAKCNKKIDELAKKAKKEGLY